MNIGIKKRWVKALRSGDFSQGKFMLKDKHENYCCLGVLCEVMKVPYLQTQALPEQSILNQAELENAGKLAIMNDTGLTFPEIADWIEENL